MQCKLHTFPVLSQDFGGKSKNNGHPLFGCMIKRSVINVDKKESNWCWPNKCHARAGQK